MGKYIILRKQKLSFLLDKQALRVITVLFVVLVLAALVSTGMGQMAIHPLNVLKALFGYGSEMEQLVVTSFRLPRIVLAILAGAALAVSGAILQGIIRNPLASPDIIGIAGGASVAVVTFFALFSDRSNSLTVSIHWLPLAAFIGAFFIGFLVYVLAWKEGVSPLRLVLIGIGLAAAMKALTTLMMILGPIYRATEANIWIIGSVHAANWREVLTLLPWVLVMGMIALFRTRHLNVQELGDEVGRGLGSAIQKERLILLILSTSLAGGAVAFAGGIGFVGLMAPHMARRLVGSAYGVLIPASALIGALIVLLADLAARTLFAPLEVPAGVFTAAIGAPYFIYLLFRQRHR
ncbi:ABC-type transporter, integral membrane subunit [Caldalkalibacillus thermarum TA2.A1]|uniref:ABC-type transporter, integral membrane subunit n=1 Tax=Caldalkalibacillus thermarum (strain TA2.A1) TaxID=986075 RepID=F5L6T8_CALTT|nr:iron ABC transporter permease [Caldalkalibacillus thermarum]EGL82924.1 ABC-type transporter, integral membrane subunit [Caldalkalibacillus thermarum TA2.A1]